MGSFVVTARLSERFKQAYLKAIRDAESGNEFILPKDIALSRERHNMHMSNLKNEGKLACAGPFADFSGALLVFDDVSEEEVQQIMEQDAHVKNSLITGWEVKEWHHSF
jgi:uncharacterized protein YciI